MTRAVVRVAFALVLGLSCGCATVAEACAQALLQSMAQVCVDVLCDDDVLDGELDELDELDELEEDRVAAHAREEPAPDWRPSEGDCEIAASDDGVTVTVSCADGTRAVFARERGGEGAPAEPAMLEGAADEACDVVRQGIDTNGDGALSSTELTGRTVDCARAPTLQGHLAIQGPNDVARLAGRRALTGGLLVRAPGLVRFEAPQLQSLGGTLRIERAAILELVALPSLARVQGDVVIARSPHLTALALPKLAHVGGSVIAVDNPQLPQRHLEEVVFRLSRHGFAGPVELAGNRP